MTKRSSELVQRLPRSMTTAVALLAALLALPLALADEDGPAAERLRRWFDLLVEAKQRRAREEPELFGR